MKKIQAIRGKLINYDGSPTLTMLCDKGIVLSGYSTGKDEVYIGGTAYPISSVVAKQLVVEITYEEIPCIPRGWESHPDSKKATKDWVKTFEKKKIDIKLGHYFMDSIHWKKVESAQKDWVELNEFAPLFEVQGDYLVMQTGEKGFQEEMRLAVSSLSFQAGATEQGFNGFYNSIPSEKRVDVLRKFTEALKILKQY